MTNKIIVTTTINNVTEEIRKYDAMPDWSLVVVGDEQSPPEYKIERGTFISWAEQLERYPDLCRLMGPRSIARGRMISFIEGYRRGADVIAVIDDDNMPYDTWGKDLLVGREVEVNKYFTDQIAFDPLPGDLWARGFPLELAEQSNLNLGMKKVTMKPLVQANLWDGDPDVDALVRISQKPDVKWPPLDPYTSNAFSPVNTQNTFIAREAIRDFPANIPFIGRADDIWASYIFQARHPNAVVYGPATVRHHQKRTWQSMLDDLENEMFLYRNNLAFLHTLKDEGVDAAVKRFLPSAANTAIRLYEDYFHLADLGKLR